jgi:hypothetical protein
VLESIISFIPRRFEVEWISKEGIGADTHTQYLTDFVNHFYKSVLKLIDRAMRKEVLRSEDRSLLEILFHLHTAITSAQGFLGREVELETVINYLKVKSSY